LKRRSAGTLGSGRACVREAGESVAATGRSVGHIRAGGLSLLSDDHGRHLAGLRQSVSQPRGWLMVRILFVMLFVIFFHGMFPPAAFSDIMIPWDQLRRRPAVSEVDVVIPDSVPENLVSGDLVSGDVASGNTTSNDKADQP
jgi:hypothetical protein